MKGFTKKRGDTWTAYWEVRDVEGDRRQKSKGGFRRQKDAQAHLTETVAAIGAGTYTEPTTKTVAVFLRSWLDGLDLRPSTLASYRHTVERWIIPELGGYKVADLSPTIIAAFYGKMRGADRLDGRGKVGGRTPQYVAVVLRKALGDAAKRGEIARNPAELVDRPKAKAAEMHPWTADEATRFLAATAADRLSALWRLALATGMRRGEILGLRWADVDLDRARLAVRQTIITVDYKVTVSEPKTAASRRTINLDAVTVAALRAHRRRQLEERMAVGAGWQDHGLVFCVADGTPIHPQSLAGTFERLTRRVGVRTVRLHDLRHTHATLGLAAGVQPKVMQERLGHSSLAITMDLYTHVIEGMQADAAEMVAAQLGGGDSC